jgi:hypothetical protein
MGIWEGKDEMRWEGMGCDGMERDGMRGYVKVVMANMI